MLDVIICTVGTSLIYPNLENLKKAKDEGKLEQRYERILDAYLDKDPDRLGRELRSIDPTDRICGAEINSLDSMKDRRGLINEDKTKLFFLYSDTDDGEFVAKTLRAWYKGNSKIIRVENLQDDNPREFRTKGLRNLAKKMCEVVLENKIRKRGINATGGYKAQIAIATLIGQALSVPIYYKHDRFNEVIEIPPMPVSLDYEYWMRISGMLSDLSRTSDVVPEQEYAEELDGDERIEAMIERVPIDGRNYIELSPVGQIFHATFKDRFASERDQFLPQPVPEAQKKEPRWEASGHIRQNPEIMSFMQKLTKEVPFVKHCATYYYNPDLPSRQRFRVSAKGIEGTISNGTWTAKIRVETSATTEGQKSAASTALNEWLVGLG